MFEAAKRAVLFLSIVGLSAGLLLADYDNPPGWDSNPSFTHQSWDFNTNANPLAPDGGFDNPFGTPSLTLDTTDPTAPMLYLPDLDNPPGLPPTSTGRTGGWLVLGDREVGDVDPIASFVIDNSPDPDATKELWFQATIRTNITDAANDMNVKVVANGQDYEAGDNVVVDVLDPLTGWARVTLLIDDIYPQPELETLEFRANIDATHFLLVDEVDIDTRCLVYNVVPEPSTLVMLLVAAGMGLFLRGRKRK